MLCLSFTQNTPVQDTAGAATIQKAKNFSCRKESLPKAAKYAQFIISGSERTGIVGWHQAWLFKKLLGTYP